MIGENERNLLRAAFDQAWQARREPKALQSILEPTWCVLFARGEQILASATFYPGDQEDPVRRAWAELEKKNTSPEGITAYLTLEPSALYQRLASTTEAIRTTGIKRVVIGAEDPSVRSRGKGIEALRKQGIEVVLANSEEARRCQMLYEDYGKVMNKSLPMLRIIWDLEPVTGEARDYELNFHDNDAPVFSDALLLRSEMLLKSPMHFTQSLSEGQWLVILDADLVLRESNEFMLKNAANILLFFPEDTAEPAFYANLRALGAQIFTIPKRTALLDLALVLRKLRDLGIFSVVCRGDWTLFFNTIQSGLVDSVLSQVGGAQISSEVLSRISQANIRSRAWEQKLQLLSPRLMSRATNNIWVEAEVKFN